MSQVGVLSGGGTSVTVAVDGTGQSAVVALTSSAAGVAGISSPGILGTSVYFLLPRPSVLLARVAAGRAA